MWKTKNVVIVVNVIAFVCCSSFPFTVSAMYNLDEDESQGGIAINLLPLVAKDLQHKADCNGDGRSEHTTCTCITNSLKGNIRIF